MFAGFDEISIARGATAIVCGAILVFGLRAFLATRRPSMFLFAVGMGTASVGFLAEGALVEIANWDLATATRVESLFTLAAFGFLAWSLLVSDRRIARTQWTRAKEGGPHGRE